MQLMLRQNVKNLGKRGDVVKVTTGYGRNYLVPRGMAVPVNPDNVSEVEEEQKRIQVVEDRRLASLTEIAEALGKTSVTIQARANEEGHLFGSVGETEIAAVLVEDKFDVESRMVVLEKHIKELGVFEVEIRLDPAVSAKVKVWVVGE